ncbi:MAG: NUDIX hydrolase N-terminal domain-containing protein [Acidimicrobiales bacterium]|jgi:ADP-ribose pyrophosphatase YjhB (NUDIX family)|nr:hydrolase [Acidimicrobiaceae bacterium]MDP6492923.1 NUDIX hydrolase N-terminal domain-containing protein [Acidimicrobiales bacterium]MDP6649158.1 NUDIX hydrolase N-terminal domain-containing protein [Acidimicrobiales bacterium]MDP6758932.1 NUDIX hydrolase N-terminal domain-containing protein [Acidimicrobiales bacterium]|tara:strand:+ start:3730 stop:4431 length:702 start_codon:yes stop_codon:yes gene_type:complete
MSVDSRAPSEVDLMRWSEALAAIARTGLAFSDVVYERERFEEVLNIAADIRERAGSAFDSETLVGGWLESVGSGVPGYVTPKVTVGAVVGNDDGEILLVQRAESGLWLYPTGWADVGYSPAEVVVKEVREETGIDCEVLRPIAILDGLRLGFTGIPLYSLVFHCRMTGGSLTPHPMECRDVGFFAEGDLPEHTILADEWAAESFAAIRGEPVEVRFDAPRDPPWVGGDPPVGA